MNKDKRKYEKPAIKVEAQEGEALLVPSSWGHEEG